MRPGTLCFLLKDDAILLAMKKRGFGAGRWNGAGGKIKDGEEALGAARRELEEEVGVTAAEGDLDFRGILTFHSETPEFNWKVHVFVARRWLGEPVETEEMRPQWFAHGEIPYDAMWVDDRHWLPLVLAGKKIEADFYFDDTGKKLEKHEIREI